MRFFLLLIANKSVFDHELALVEDVRIRPKEIIKFSPFLLPKSFISLFIMIAR